MKLPRWWAKPTAVRFTAIASAYRGSTPRFPVSHQQEQITAQFLQASTQGDLQGLMALLAKCHLLVGWWWTGCRCSETVTGGNESRSVLGASQQMALHRLFTSSRLTDSLV